MDQNFINIVSSYWWAILLLIIMVAGLQLMKMPEVKGWLGEKQVQLLGLNKLDKDIYATINDLYLPRPDGEGTTQIDHLVISKFGLFVIETKNYDHWIYGSEKQKQWTQKIYKKSFKFQNPLHQNALHINALVELLKLDKSYFHNVIFFVGDSTFKTEMPANVLNKGLTSYLKSFTKVILDQEYVIAIADKLKRHDSSMNKKAVAKQHKQDLQKRC